MIFTQLTLTVMKLTTQSIVHNFPVNSNLLGNFIIYWITCTKYLRKYLDLHPCCQICNAKHVLYSKQFWKKTLTWLRMHPIAVVSDLTLVTMFWMVISSGHFLARANLMGWGSPLIEPHYQWDTISGFHI